MTTISKTAVSSSLWELKQCIAETLVRSQLDYTDDILILNAFLRDFRWKEGVSGIDAKEQWASQMRGTLPPSHLFSLYIHVPYCQKKCHFCHCPSKTASNPRQIESYVPDVRKEIDFFAPLFKGVPVRWFSVGGGTPSMLSPSQLEDLLGSVGRNFNLEEEGIRSIEFNPASTDLEKLKTVRKAGFNRISFGVQTLTPSALERQNREYQTEEMVRNAVRWAKECGFEIINLDLLMGLAGDDLDGLLRSFRIVAETQPSLITVTGLSLTDAYIKTMGTSREKNMEYYDRLFPRALEGVRRLAKEHGYRTDELTPNKGNWAVSSENISEEWRRRMLKGDQFAENMSILGLGHNSLSYLFGRCVFERNENSFDPSDSLYRKAPKSFKEEMMQYLLYTLEHYSRIQYPSFQKRFGEDIRKWFNLELRVLQSLGKIRLESDGFSFLPVQGPERIFYGLFFLLDTLAELPFSKGRITAALRKRLLRELPVLDS